MENKKPIVILENVTKIFNKKNWAIKKINLKITRGDGLAVIGPNSSGKSVLARLIASLIKPTSGIVEYNFTKGDTYSSIGFQFFQVNWPDGFRVREIVNLYKKIYDIKDEAWLEKINLIFDINSRWDRRLNSCGNSWLKLFSLYLALIHKPELLILDEVSNSIGLDMKQKIVEFLKEYKQDYHATIIIISPDEMLFELCDKVIVLQKGLIASEDLVAEMPQDLNFKEYVFQIMRALEEEQVEIAPDPIFRPILRKYEIEKNIFEEEYQKLLNHKNLATVVDQSLSLTMIKNYHFHVSSLHTVLLKAATSELDKKYLDEVSSEIKTLLKTVKHANRLVRKEPNDFKYKKISSKFLNNNLRFINYVKEQLNPMFKSSKLIIAGNEITAELSSREQVKLKSLKKKYIQEEIRLMKAEQKLWRRQARRQQVE